MSEWVLVAYLFAITGTGSGIDANGITARFGSEQRCAEAALTMRVLFEGYGFSERDDGPTEAREYVVECLPAK